MNVSNVTVFISENEKLLKGRCDRDTECDKEE